MAEYRGIKLLFILMLELQFTGASFFVQLGDDVTFPCKNVINNRDKCDSTTWIFSVSRSSVELVNLGIICGSKKSLSDRLNVTENCSLVIKNVTLEDAGQYTCRQFILGQQKGGDAKVDLFVVTMTQHEDAHRLTLNCFVSTCDPRRLSVKWLYDDEDVNTSGKVIKATQSPCNATVTFVTSPSTYSSAIVLFKCEVRKKTSFQLFPFTPQAPGEKPDKTTTAATDSSGWWWLFLTVGLVLVALLILAVIGWKRTQGNKSRINNKVELTSKPAASPSAPETTHNKEDPEEGVSYASISFKKKSNGGAPFHTKNDDDESDSVTYITVKASSTDDSDLYAAIRKP